MSPSTRRSFLRQLGLATGGSLLLGRLPVSRAAADARSLPRSTPEAEGVDSAGLLAFLAGIAAGPSELHSFMMLRHGRVVAEGWWSPYAPELRHTLYSLSKSFTSTAVGFAVAEGRLRVQDKVVSFFPDDLPASVSPNLAAMRVQDLLTMSTGHETEPMQEMIRQDHWVKPFLAWPVPQEPGSHFLYNSGATFMLSAIVQKLTGQPILAYLTSRLFEPLGIRDVTWESTPDGINTGGWGLSVHTEDIAKLGQFCLQKGAWNGRQLLPASWIEEATAFHIQQPLKAHPARPKEQDDWEQGYGYQFWRCTHGVYRGDGAFGQFMIVLPQHDAVIAMTGESKDLQGELDLVWQHLLPAIHEQPLPAHAEAESRLREKLAALQLPPPASADVTKGGPHPSVPAKSYRLEENPLGLRAVSFAFSGDACQVTFRDAANEYPIVCGWEKWRRGETALPGVPPRYVKSRGSVIPGTQHPLAASAAWRHESMLELTLRYLETPHHDTVTFSFEGPHLKIAFLSSISQLHGKPDDRPVLSGESVAE